MAVLRRSLRVLIAAGFALAAAPVCAQTYYADGPNAGGAANLSVIVKASVGGHCGFTTTQAPNGSYDQPDFDVAGLARDFAFQLDCTGPSRVAVVSANGGLKTSGTAPAGYATLAPYDVSLNLVGATATASASCPVAGLTAGAASPCAFRGPATTTAGLRLSSNSVGQTGSYLRVSAPAYAGTLVAGSYTDTLTITVSVAP